MTSNLGAAHLNDTVGGGAVNADTKERVMDAIRAHLPPEYYNRIDDIIVFRPLSRNNVTKIVDIRLKEVQARLADRKMTLELSSDAKHYLGSIGYSATYGARPLNRAIQHELLNPLSVMILSDQVRDGETVRVDFDGPHNRLVIDSNHEASSDAMDMDWEDADDIDIQEMD
jgi:ATP-dependent Clp protease ATP-binding subunit ClpB